MTNITTAVLIFICFALPHSCLAALNCTSHSPHALMNALKENLFPNNLVRPVKHISDTLNITVSITVVGILGVNEKHQSLTTFIWQVLEWDIDGLSWDEKECGSERVSVPREKIWTPDIRIAEFMEEDKSPKTPYVYLYNTGHVFDDKPVRVTSSCQLEIYTFPFDIQNCSLTFESFLHFAEDIKMIEGTTAEEILRGSREVIKTNGEWELADINISPTSLILQEASYSEIKYFIILRRRPILYVVNLLIPSCFLSTLDIFTFLLPPHSVDRCSIKVTLILGYTVFLLIMNDLLPVTGYSTPLLNVLFSISFALMVTSLLETVFITNIQLSASHYSAVPHWLRVLVLRYLAVVVCLPPPKKSNRITVSLHPPAIAMNTSIISANELQRNPGYTPSVKPLQDLTLDELRKLSTDLTAIRNQMEKHLNGTKTTQEWSMIVTVMDRLLFGVYIVFGSVSFITIVCIWLSSYSYVM